MAPQDSQFFIRVMISKINNPKPKTLEPYYITSKKTSHNLWQNKAILFFNKFAIVFFEHPFPSAGWLAGWLVSCFTKGICLVFLGTFTYPRIPVALLHPYTYCTCIIRLEISVYIYIYNWYTKMSIPLPEYIRCRHIYCKATFFFVLRRLSSPGVNKLNKLPNRVRVPTRLPNR